MPAAESIRQPVYRGQLLCSCTPYIGMTCSAQCTVCCSMLHAACCAALHCILHSMLYALCSTVQFMFPDLLSWHRQAA